MLNEKKVMSDKLLTATLLYVAAGFLLGIGLFFAGAAFITKDPAMGVIGGLIVVLASVCGHIGDKARNVVKEYINQGYVKLEESENDRGNETEHQEVP